MRAVAEVTRTPDVTYRDGPSSATGLETESVDVVTVVQAMHWMEPGPTLDEVARVLRPRGVLAGYDHVDPHRTRTFPDGLRSWSKSGHLARMEASGHFAFTRELAMCEEVEGGARRFCDLMYSQGSYQGLLRHGLSDGEIGGSDFERTATQAFDRATVPPRLAFTWRVRLGVTPPATGEPARG